MKSDQRLHYCKNIWPLWVETFFFLEKYNWRLLTLSKPHAMFGVNETEFDANELSTCVQHLCLALHCNPPPHASIIESSIH